MIRESLRSEVLDGLANEQLLDWSARYGVVLLAFGGQLVTIWLHELLCDWQRVGLLLLQQGLAPESGIDAVRVMDEDRSWLSVVKAAFVW